MTKLNSMKKAVEKTSLKNKQKQHRNRKEKH